MKEKKVALITGVTGQDGSYLAEFLLEKGYEVHGTIRRSSVDFRERIAHLEGKPNFHLHYADLGDSMSILGVIGKWASTRLSLPPMSMLLACSVYLRLCASSVSPKTAASIRLPHLSSMARWRKCRRMRILRSIPILHTQSQSSMVSGL